MSERQRRRDGLLGEPGSGISQVLVLELELPYPVAQLTRLAALLRGQAVRAHSLERPAPQYDLIGSTPSSASRNPARTSFASSRCGLLRLPQSEPVNETGSTPAAYSLQFPPLHWEGREGTHAAVCHNRGISRPIEEG